MGLTGDGTKGKLQGKKLAILLTDGFEQVEMTGPREAFEREGATCVLVAPEASVQGFKHQDKAERFDVQLLLDKAHAKDFDALVLPGGVANPDRLRTLPQAVAFVRDFVEQGKLVAAICHGPWTLIEAGAARGRTMTSWPSLKTDLENAGAHWVDREVVADRNVVTSRKPDDIPAFAAKAVELLHAQGAPQAAASRS